MAERLPFEPQFAHPQHPPAFRLIYVTPLTFHSGHQGHVHSHNCVEIFFIMGGKGVFFVRNERIAVSQDDFIIVNPAVEHTEEADLNARMDYIVIGLEGAAFLLENQSQGYFFGSYMKNRQLFCALLHALTCEVQAKEDRYQEVCRSLINILLSYIWRMTGLQIVEVEAEQLSARQSSHRIAWVKQYLDDHFTHDVNLNDLSAQVSLNKYSIVRMFKQTYGVSPMRYVLDRRFDEAAFYLKTSSVSIKQIAALSGFSSANYFSQMFQRREGISPTEYRRRHQKEMISAHQLQAEALGVERPSHGESIREDG